MIRFFTKRNAFHVPVLILLALILKVPFFNNEHQTEIIESSGILDLFLRENVFLHISTFGLACINLIFVLFSGFYINYLMIQKRMFQSTHFLVALSYIFLTSLLPGPQILQAGTILSPVVILLYQQLTKLYNTQSPIPILVNIGFITGICIVLHHPLIWLTPFCFLSLATLRAFRLKEWVLLMISILIPFYFFLSYQYLTDQWNPSLLWPVFYNKIFPPVINKWWTISILVSLLWLIVGFFQWQNGTRRMLIQTRKNWYILLFLAFFLLPSIFYPHGNLMEGFSLLCIPASTFCAFSFNNQKGKLWQSLLFWLIVITSFIVGWATQGSL